MRGWSTNELAPRAHISEDVVASVEAATAVDIRIDTLVALANGFDVDIEVFLAPRNIKSIER